MLQQAATCSCGQLHTCGWFHGMPAGLVSLVTCAHLVSTATPSLHALQRCQPALLTSAGPRLMLLVPVSGWITASSAAACSPGCCLGDGPVLQSWPDAGARSQGLLQSSPTYNNLVV